MIRPKALSYCYARLPKTGLGNMLLVWARALVFAHLNNLPLLVSGWSQARVGPFLRRERSKRLYLNYFKNLNTISLFEKLIFIRTYNWVIEPDIAPLSSEQHKASRSLYVFRETPHWSDYFYGIKDHRDFIREGLYHMLSQKHYEKLSNLRRPVIGVHVRRGDFRELRPGEDISQSGLTRTPLNYFKNLIDSIRVLHSVELPVTIFSDGSDDELNELLNMPNAYRSGENSDIVDLLLLSKSRIVITSRASTFSYWGAFLSDAPVILHPDHRPPTHAPVRSLNINRTLFEGSVTGAAEMWPELLVRNIKAIMP